MARIDQSRKLQTTVETTRPGSVSHDPLTCCVCISQTKSFFRLAERLIFPSSSVKVRFIHEALRQGVCIAEGEDTQRSVVPTIRVHRLQRIPRYRPPSPPAACVYVIEISSPQGIQSQNQGVSDYDQECFCASDRDVKAAWVRHEPKCVP